MTSLENEALLSFGCFKERDTMCNWSFKERCIIEHNIIRERSIVVMGHEYFKERNRTKISARKYDYQIHYHLSKISDISWY